MEYVVMDLEFNQFFPFKSGSHRGANPACPFEIIQIGAIKLNEKFETLGSFDEFIKPQIYKRIHPFVEKITGITQKDLKNAREFAEVYSSFSEFAGKDSIICTWGPDDIKSLFRNVLFYELDPKSITDHYINVQKYASDKLEYENGGSIGLKNAVTKFGLAIEDEFHNAFYDAKYTAEIFRLVCDKNTPVETFELLSLVRTPKTATTRKVNFPALITHFENLLSRQLSNEEKALVRAAYKLGLAQTFEKTRKKTDSKSQNSQHESGGQAHKGKKNPDSNNNASSAPKAETNP